MSELNASPVQSGTLSAEDAAIQRHYGGWVPKDRRLLDKWIHNVILRVEAENKRHRQKYGTLPALADSIKDFINLIENDPVIYMNFTLMFPADPSKPGDTDLPKEQGLRKLTNYYELMVILNDFIQSAPRYEKIGETDIIGVPIYCILDPIMNTAAGAIAFLHPAVNEKIKNILDAWGTVLVDPASASTLNGGKEGWLSPDALRRLGETAGGKFEDLFVCDPSLPHWGFASWDDFFARHFRVGARQVANPNDHSLIISPCEGAVYRTARNVDAKDTFWVKGQPYSIKHMLGHNPYYSDFIGGSIFQAFLSPFNYHRWHSPVDGTIKAVQRIEGSYYAAIPDNEGPDAIVRSQGYITHTATRLLIFIECDNPDIGLICFIAVGMVEVSSCKALVEAGEHVKKGQELGTFHFGGSSFCLLFRPETNVTFLVTENEKPIKVNSEIARVG